ncbi:MAG: MlaD family protein [Nitrospira sp.]|nr:MlaD family protein [Nitrospira sp.]
MQKFSTEVKVGLFVIISAVLLVYMTFKVGEFSIGGDKGYMIYAYFNSVSGLDNKAAVKIAGVAVGTVELIELEENRAKVGMRIKSYVRIRKDTVASVKSQSLLGEKYVELFQGRDEVLLKDGGIIYNSIAVADMDTLITKLYSISEDIKVISSAFKDTLGDSGTQDSIRNIVSNLSKLTENLANISEREGGSVEKIIKDVEGLVQQAKGITVDNREPLKNVVANLERISNDLSIIARDNKEPIRNTMANLQQLSSDLKDKTPGILSKVDTIVGRIDRGEGTVGKLMKEDGLYQKLDSTLSGLDKYVSAAERFKLNVGFRGEYMFDNRNTKGYFSLRLQPMEDKYYLFEVADDPRGRVRVTDTTDVTTPPGTAVTVHQITRDDKLKASALFGRKFGHVGFRGGLMESTFGMGGDYYLDNDNFRATIDVWNFNGDTDAPKPHMKLTASYTVFKTLFVDVGVDDFVNSKRSSTFAGAGLSFYDEDLKYLLTKLPMSLP